MAPFKDSGTPGLQELIDSYNDEIMRYSRMAQPPQSGATERETAEIQREQGEFDIERGITERRFWQAEGKQGMQRTATERETAEIQREQGEFDIERGITERQFWQAEGKQGMSLQSSNSPARQHTNTGRNNRPEPDEPLYAPNSHMPRPLPVEPLERPDGMPKYANAGHRIAAASAEAVPAAASAAQFSSSAAPHSGSTNRPSSNPAPSSGITAHSSDGTARNTASTPRATSPSSPQEQWVLDLQQGLRDLERGLQELAKGQRELREGQLAYEQGIAERDYWRSMAQGTPAAGMANAPNAPSPVAGAENARNTPPPAVRGAVNSWGMFSPATMSDEKAGNMRTTATSGTDNTQKSTFMMSDAPQSLQNRNFSDFYAPLSQNNENFFASDGKIFPSRTGQITPADEPLPNLPEYPTARGQQSIDADGSGMGFLQVIAYTARRASPIPGARVTVFRPSAKGDILISSGETNDDGKTPLLSLPAGTASGGGFAAPFSLYNVSVTADGYMPRNYLPAQIFDGITALLPVEMIPLPDFPHNGM